MMASDVKFTHYVNRFTAADAIHKEYDASNSVWYSGQNGIGCLSYCNKIGFNNI